MSPPPPAGGRCEFLRIATIQQVFSNVLDYLPARGHGLQDVCLLALLCRALRSEVQQLPAVRLLKIFEPHLQDTVLGQIMCAQALQNELSGRVNGAPHCVPTKVLLCLENVDPARVGRKSNGLHIFSVALHCDCDLHICIHRQGYADEDDQYVFHIVVHLSKDARAEAASALGLETETQSAQKHIFSHHERAGIKTSGVDCLFFTKLSQYLHLHDEALREAGCMNAWPAMRWLSVAVTGHPFELWEQAYQAKGLDELTMKLKIAEAQMPESTSRQLTRPREVRQRRDESVWKTSEQPEVTAMLASLHPSTVDAVNMSLKAMRTQRRDETLTQLYTQLRVPVAVMPQISVRGFASSEEGGRTTQRSYKIVYATLSALRLHLTLRAVMIRSWRGALQESSSALDFKCTTSSCQTETSLHTVAETLGLSDLDTFARALLMTLCLATTMSTHEASKLFVTLSRSTLFEKLLSAARNDRRSDVV